MFLIDTDILVDFLRGKSQAVHFLQKALQSECYITTITVAELYSGVREGKERPILEQFIKEFKPLALTEEVALIGGLLKRDYGKSHGTGLADALIAATAIHYDVRLASLNKKHYPMLKNIHVPYKP